MGQKKVTQLKKTSNGRQPSIENETTSNERQSPMEYDLQWKTTSMEEHIQWKVPSMEDDLQWKTTPNGR